MLLAATRDNVIREGSRVVLYQTFDNMQILTAVRDGVTMTRLGEFHHNDMVGYPFGTRVRAGGRRGAVRARAVRLIPPLCRRRSARGRAWAVG